MLKFVYLVIAMAAAPFLMEFINTRSKMGNTVLFLKGVPAYLVNVIVCAVLSLVICLLPGGWSFALADFAIVLFAVYFGNQFFFNMVIKPLMAYRKRGN